VSLKGSFLFTAIHFINVCFFVRCQWPSLEMSKVTLPIDWTNNTKWRSIWGQILHMKKNKYNIHSSIEYFKFTMKSIGSWTTNSYRRSNLLLWIFTFNNQFRECAYHRHNVWSTLWIVLFQEFEFVLTFQLTFPSLRRFARYCPSLRTLDLFHNTSITDEGVRDLLIGNTNLLSK
jgi:hypothetical protein